MANIVVPFAASALQPVPSVGFNSNFTEVASKFNTYAVQTDVAKVITVTHQWNASQTFNAGALMAGDLLFTDALYDIGKSGLTRPRDGFFSRNVTVGGTLTASLTGNASTATALQTARTINGVSFDGTAAIVVPAAAGTLTGASLAAGVTGSSLTSLGTMAADLVFTDALYDIGKSGATRPRDLFLSRNLVVGGTANFTGIVSFTDVTTKWANNAGLKWRNNGNTLDLGALAVDVTDTLRVGYDTNLAGTSLGANAKKLGFYGIVGVTQPTVTGAKGGNAALTSLMAALGAAGLGLVNDTTT